MQVNSFGPMLTSNNSAQSPRGSVEQTKNRVTTPQFSGEKAKGFAMGVGYMGALLCLVSWFSARPQSCPTLEHAHVTEVLQCEVRNAEEMRSQSLLQKLGLGGVLGGGGYALMNLSKAKKSSSQDKEEPQPELPKSS